MGADMSLTPSSLPVGGGRLRRGAQCELRAAGDDRGAAGLYEGTESDGGRLQVSHCRPDGQCALVDLGAKTPDLYLDLYLLLLSVAQV